MPRSRDVDRRQQLLEEIVDHLALHGISEMSLRPLAEALGTSSRMLVYYFQTKENLLASALAAGSDRLLAEVAGGSAAGPRAGIEAMWRRIAGPESTPVFRLLAEVSALAVSQPERYAAVAAQVQSGWLAEMERTLRDTGLPAAQAAAQATVIVDAIRGLAGDLLASGERRRVESGLQTLLDLLEGSWPATGGAAPRHGTGRRGARTLH